MHDLTINKLDQLQAMLGRAQAQAKACARAGQDREQQIIARRIAGIKKEIADLEATRDERSRPDGE